MPWPGVMQPSNRGRVATLEAASSAQYHIFRCDGSVKMAIVSVSGTSSQPVVRAGDDSGLPSTSRGTNEGVDLVFFLTPPLNVEHDVSLGGEVKPFCVEFPQQQP